MDHDGGGGGGLDFGAFKAMINADDPAMLGKYVLEHYKLARELHDVAHDLDRSLGQLDEVFDSQHAAPALKARLLSSIRDMDNIGARVEGNSRLLDQAAEALHRAREAVNGITDHDPDASPRAEAIRDELGFRYTSITAQLDIFTERIGDGDPPAGDGDDSAGGEGGSASHSGETGSSGFFVPTTGPSRRSSPAARFAPGPTLGGRSGAGGKPGPGTDSAGAKSGSRGGIGSGTGTGAGSRGRVGLPGARAGAPIGGYRPAAGAPGTGGGVTLPGASGQGKLGTPGGPGRPGMAAPGGTGPGQPGKDRPGRRLTNYEKLEPDVFRDTRRRVKPVIGEQRRQPDTFAPTPGAIGGKQTSEENATLPELPTRETPKRFEGHDVSVSFTRRTRGGQ